MSWLILIHFHLYRQNEPHWTFNLARVTVLPIVAVGYIPTGGGGPLVALPSQRWSPAGQMRWRCHCRCLQPEWCPSAGCHLTRTTPVPASGTSWSWRRRTETDEMACTQKTNTNKCDSECVCKYTWLAVIHVYMNAWVCTVPLQREFPEDIVNLLQVISVHPFRLMGRGGWVDRWWAAWNFLLWRRDSQQKGRAIRWIFFFLKRTSRSLNVLKDVQWTLPNSISMLSLSKSERLKETKHQIILKPLIIGS